MERFHIIEDGAVILRVPPGTFKQAKIYHRGKHVYAEVGKDTYVRLQAYNGTSNPKITWLEVEGDDIGIVNGIPVWVEPEEKPEPVPLKVVS